MVIRLVLRRGRRHQRQRIENRRFLIFWISLVHSFHRILVGFGARRVATLLPAVIEVTQRLDDFFFPPRCWLQLPRPRNSPAAPFDFRRPPVRSPHFTPSLHPLPPLP